MVLEVLALLFGEEYVREVGWSKKLSQTIWGRQVPSYGENSNEPTRSIKDGI